MQGGSGYHVCTNEGGMTTTFDKREDGFEKKFAHDEELKFKASARRNKLLGMWAAEKMGLTGAQAARWCRRRSPRSRRAAEVTAFTLARRLRAGETVYAAWCTLASPIVAETIAREGFSAVVLEIGRAHV